jgi:hypothetical protein
MKEICAGGGDLAVCPGHLRSRLGPVVRPAPLAGHPPLVAGQVPLLPGQMPEIGDLLTLRGHREIFATQVHTDRRTGSNDERKKERKDGYERFVSEADPATPGRIFLGPDSSRP